ncbi:MAG: DNA cytosine methyltransferase [Hormoscilla sp. SP5CHS1]|nr:DNA cytosine methyltransferase [Hormoscilla sp. SP12CHS1]MBC6454752.1 DNA cytosine methyltransferase [Hormoscilla sp. SP5CHS1]
MSLTMINALSLFSGCGGCSLGLKQAGFAVKLAADIDADSCETYAVNLGRETLRRVYLSHVQPEELLGRSGLDPTVPEKSELDIIVGGPPCQGFSSAGNKDWADPRNSLLKKFVEIVTSLQPTWFIMENIEGLLTAKDGFFTIEAIARFLEAGYWVKAKKVYMEEYGLPQKRKRVFVVGNLEQCQFEFPPITYHNSNQLSLFDFSRSAAIGTLSYPSSTPLGTCQQLPHRVW